MNIHRSPARALLHGPLLAGAIAGWGLSAGAEPLPQIPTPSPAPLETIFPAPPPPVLVEGGLPATIVEAPAEGVCCECQCPPVHGPVRKLYHYHLKPCLQASHWGYADLFQPRPFGSYARFAAGSQIENGLSAQLVLYRMDFVARDGLPTAELNPSGRARLEKVLGLVMTGACPLVIELDERNPELNAARRAHVVGQLQQFVAGFPEERVVVGRPAARGLAAEEAVAIQQIVQEQVRTMGAVNSYSGGNLSPFSGAPGGSTTSGSSGGGGGSGGGSSGSSR
jgi:hypothetical protein